MFIFQHYYILMVFINNIKTIKQGYNRPIHIFNFIFSNITPTHFLIF
nr:MAG TPA: hypothetical protein [Caudoviricetes sp.]